MLIFVKKCIECLQIRIRDIYIVNITVFINCCRLRIYEISRIEPDVIATTYTVIISYVS